MKPIDAVASLLREAGAVAYGTTPAAPVADEDWRRFDGWLGRGLHAGMAYMERWPEIRRDPRLLLPGAASIVSAAFNYRQPNPLKGVATYALGRDYHKVLRKRLKRVVASLKAAFGGEWRICIDSAPVLERYWAERAGVGRRSPLHGNVVVPGVGSMVFLAELITTLNLPVCSENFVLDRAEGSLPPEGEGVPSAGVCPTGALLDGGMVDSRRCINYLTIEHPGPLSEEERVLTGGALFGCDVCQRVAPENRIPCQPVLDEFRPMPGLKEFLEGENVDFDLSESPLKRGLAARTFKKC